MMQRMIPAMLVGMGGLWGPAGCAPTEPNRLDELSTVRMTIKGQPFELWVADSFRERLAGLMFITAEEMAPLPDGTERGMLFVFDHSERGSFWMKNTIIPLDVAYVATDGTVVSTYSMTPLDDRLNAYPPGGSYRYAIETLAPRLEELGLSPGDVLSIPAEVLKGAS